MSDLSLKKDSGVLPESQDPEIDFDSDPVTYCITYLKTLKCSCVWVINHFKHFCERKTAGDKISSSIFEPDSKEVCFQLHVYPKGHKSNSADDLRLLSFDLELLSSNVGKIISTHVDLTVSDDAHTIMSSHNYQGKLRVGAKTIHKVFPGDNNNRKILPAALTIRCNVTAFVSEETDCWPTLTKTAESLSTDCAAMFEHSTFSDVTIHAGSRQFKVHKCVLAVRSPVFAAMFKYSLKEEQTSSIIIEDVKPDILRKLLLFMYSGRIPPMDEKCAFYLLVAADKYGVCELTKLCEATLLNILSKDNACQILLLADKHSRDSLRSEVLKFVNQYSKEVSKMEAWPEVVSHFHDRMQLPLVNSK